MRLTLVLSAFSAFVIIFLTANAASEKYEHDNWTVSSNQSEIFDGDEFWIQGDILIDGELTIKDSSINVNRSLDLTISEIRINSTGKLNLINTTITTMENETYGFTSYTLVSDGGEVSIEHSQIYYAMIWLVGGNAIITDLSLEGYGMSNYGIFSEDTNLTASGVSIRNYTLGLRAIGSSPTLNSVFYYNCSTQMTQEWWVTFLAIEESTGLPISGFEIKQWDVDGQMILPWYWAKQFEIDSHGQVVNHSATFTSYLNLNFAHIEDGWAEPIISNTEVIRTYDMNHYNISYDSAILFVDGVPLASGQIVPKWSEINISIVIDNPTDMTFNNLYLNLAVNGEPGFARTSLKLPAGTSLRVNLTWLASLEGPLSLGVSTVVIDYSGNLTDYTITLSRFVEVEVNSSSGKISGSWVALFAFLTVLLLCTYIIYSGIEEDSQSHNLNAEDDSNSSDERIEEDEYLGEKTVLKESEDEKEN